MPNRGRRRPQGRGRTGCMRWRDRAIEHRVGHRRRLQARRLLFKNPEEFLF